MSDEDEPEEVMQHTPLPSRPQTTEEAAPDGDGGAPTELVPVQLFPEGDDQEQEAPVVIKTKIKHKHTNQDRA